MLHLINYRTHLLVSALAVGTLVNCNCEEEEFLPAATYTPPASISFGNVSVRSEKTLPLEVQSNGRAGLIIAAANLVSTSQDGTWRAEVSPDLMEGLRPGLTSTIALTFRPCPDAWDSNNELIEGFDFDTCPGTPQAADLNVTDNTREQSKVFSLSATPAQPPVITVRCPQTIACGEPDPEMRDCTSVSFGTVSAADPACDLVIEVENSFREDKPTGDLVIESINIVVRDVTFVGTSPRTDGVDAGFTLHNLDGSPLEPDSDNPVVVPIESGKSTGTTRFLLRFTGTQNGIWRGSPLEDAGIRFVMNDPDFEPVFSVGVSGEASAPDLQCNPLNVDFGPVEQGTTATATVTCANNGNATLQVADMAVSSPEFSVSTDRGTTSNFSLATNERVSVFVGYTPQDTGTDAEMLQISSNDPAEPVLAVNLRGGAVPRIEVSPNDTLVFPIPDPPEDPPVPRDEILRIANVGFGDLNVSRVTITGPGGDLGHESVDDFNVEGACSGQNPCDINLMLCAPGAGCSNDFEELTIRYDNDDISTTDLAELHIFSDDPTDPEHIVVLSANDEPCLFPSCIIDVETTPLCINQAITVTGMNSRAGAPGETVTDYEWFWVFSPGLPPTIADPTAETTTVQSGEPNSFILGLRCTNSCGSMSQRPAQETLLIGDCGN